MSNDKGNYELLPFPPPSQSAVTSAKAQAVKPTFLPPNFRSLALPTNDPFLHALYIRKTVFVIEQKCDLDLEIDDDDAKSFHWVLVTGKLSGRDPVPQSEDDGVAAATVRLVLARPHLHTADLQDNVTNGAGELIADAEQEKGERPLATHDDRPSEPDMEHSTIWDGHELYIKIGRLATLKEFRGRGYGKVLVDAAVEYAQRHPSEMLLPGVEGKWEGLVIAHAQKDALKFYERCGFREDKGMGRFWEEGIEHVGVWKRVELG